VPWISTTVTTPLRTRSIPGAQIFLERSRGAYVEVTPSGTGLRIWGLAEGAALNRKFDLEIDGKAVTAELFRKTNKPLTVTGLELGRARTFNTNIDPLLKWAVTWGERRKAAAPAVPDIEGNGFGGNGSRRYSPAEIDEFVRTGAPGGNRSNLFHTAVGHYRGVGWDQEQTLAHIAQFPTGIGEKYIREGRLSSEVARSFEKYDRASLPVIGNVAGVDPSSRMWSNRRRRRGKSNPVIWSGRRGRSRSRLAIPGS
jgi:hypothetical protein